MRGKRHKAGLPGTSVGELETAAPPKAVSTSLALPVKGFHD